jgi:aminopeptidase N
MRLTVLVFLLLLLSCNPPKYSPPSDPHSFSNPHEAVIRHLSLHLNVDFNEQKLSGTAEYTIENKSGTRELKLDSRHLQIEKAEADGREVSFHLSHPDSTFGSCLTIHITPQTKKVKVFYSTLPGAEALQWLSPGQTTGGIHPFLFTQSQAILARTWIPVQDSPGVRFTYDATITCPPSLMALMSAENDTVLHADGLYHFQMPQPVPSYLLALAVGDLRFHAYDHRCGIYAEPAVIEKAAYEFADMPAMIDSASQLYGDYRWGRFDVLVLPPSFPFGGMENPRLTFATPTVIAGDRSLTSLIAHELAHSWSGNLVTNATWNDFWLNEGFTTYFEMRIMEKIYGKPYAEMLSKISLDELKHTVKEMGDTNPDTRLFLDLKGRNPDDGVTDIAYEKGRMFLTLLEQTTGRERWDAFLKNYFNEHAFQSMTTERFEQYLNAHLLTAAEKEKVNVKQWIYEPGLPDDCPEVVSGELLKAEDAARELASGKEPGPDHFKNWTTHHYLHFMRSLPDKLSLSQLYFLDKNLGFNTVQNAEIRCQWLQLCIRNEYRPAYENLEDFLLTVGRRKFVRPLYKQLAASSHGREFARRVYENARAGYHSVTRQTIDEILGWKQ